MAVVHLYGAFPTHLVNARINMASDTLKLMLVTSSYTPAQDTHTWKSDITNEVVGTGYTAGGAAVASVTTSYNSTTHTMSFTGSNVSWTTSTITARYGVLYDSTPSTDATRPLIGYIDFGANISSTTATFSVVWDPSGIGSVTVS